MALVPHESWREVARRTGGEYTRKNLSGSVYHNVRGGNIQLAHRRVSRSRVDTQLRATYTTLDHFRFEIRCQNFAEAIITFLGREDVEIGDPAFDARIVVSTNDASRAREFFADEVLRRSIVTLADRQRFSVGVQDADPEGPFSLFGTRLTIAWDRMGIVDNVRLLVTLIRLFERMLDRLCDIGSAKCRD